VAINLNSDNDTMMMMMMMMMIRIRITDKSLKTKINGCEQSVDRK
jgi:hypothetical protein